MMKRNVIFTALICALIAFDVPAAVVQRSGAKTTAASRTSVGRTAPATQAKATTVSETVEQVVEQSEPQVVESKIIENKSSQFNTSLNNALASDGDDADSDLAARIREQIASLDAADALTTSAATAKSALAAGKNSCDSGLRQCMTEKCGTNFLKCSSDTDTTFGTKLDSCRGNLKCTADEFKLFATEIKSDRATNIKLKTFNDILDCGRVYDACIIEQCGTKYSKCLGKSAGDAAISKCASIAQKCASSDNGLANRTMSVFGTLRQTAEKQISADEKKLYALRDQMKSLCSRLGAMFDERTLDCVYTVNFYAGNDSTLFASKKAYAGGSFDCTPNWFGVDVTTYMENAARLTREQTSASSAMLGSGVGMGVGAITSGAVGRAIETQKAEKALDKAKCEDESGMKWNSVLGKCVEDNSAEKAEKKAERTQEREERKAERAQNREEKKNANKDNNKTESEKPSDDKDQENAKKAEPDTFGLKSKCESSGGTYSGNVCICKFNQDYVNGKCQDKNAMYMQDTTFKPSTTFKPDTSIGSNLNFNATQPGNNTLKSDFNNANTK